MDKEQILEEIRRTAKANGGKPLGELRLRRETGITRSDWMGKYWARWGDALQEAGFSRNEFQGPIGDAVLFNKYIELVRELGHLPVNAEIKLKIRKDPSFPWPGTFGRKADFIGKLILYCQSHSEYKDIALLCKEYLPRDEGTSKANKPDEDQIGFIYLIKSGRFHKIGRTNAAGRREYELALQLPEKAATVHVIRTDDPCGIEAYWHKRFETKRKNGEWFELSATDIAAFKRRKFM